MQVLWGGEIMRKFVGWWRPNRVIGGLGLVVLLVFSLWYRGGQNPISEAEQQLYWERLQQLPADIQPFVDLEATREFMRTDDGKAFYVVNLFKLKQTTQYLLPGMPTISGREAMNRFSRAAIPIWLRHATHPVFASGVSERFSDDWDFVTVVRYRSRRDFVAIQTSAEFGSALSYRLAASEENIRVKLPGVLIPSPILVVGLLVLMVFIVVNLFNRKTNNDYR